MKSQNKVQRRHPDAKLGSGYAGMDNRIFLGPQLLSDCFSQARYAWADAWRRIQLADAEAALRKTYSEFSHTTFGDIHYIGRWSGKTMNDCNQIGSGWSYLDALKDALLTVRREQRSAKKGQK